MWFCFRATAAKKTLVNFGGIFWKESLALTIAITPTQIRLVPESKTNDLRWSPGVLSYLKHLKFSCLLDSIQKYTHPLRSSFYHIQEIQILHGNLYMSNNKLKLFHYYSSKCRDLGARRRNRFHRSNPQIVAGLGLIRRIR